MSDILGIFSVVMCAIGGFTVGKLIADAVMSGRDER